MDAADGESVCVDLVYPAEQTCFQGHFPGFPVLPGVAQLAELRKRARAAFPDFPDAAVYRQLKFRRIITPGMPVNLKISRTAPGAFRFAFTADGEVCSSGTVVAGGTT